VIVCTQPGEPVREGQPVLELRHRGGHGLKEALAVCRAALAIGESAPAQRPAVQAEVR
jgi:hypothetical protein